MVLFSKQRLRQSPAPWIAGLGALSMVLLTAGCAAAVPRLQWPVEPPPPLAQQPRLWIALAARLGDAASASPLVLRSASGNLTLRDAAGYRLTAARIALQWRPVAEPQPWWLRRRVAGPFASFETAESKAQQWRALGVEVTIARPAEWELWAPVDAPIPAGWKVRALEQQQRQRLEPVLSQGGQPPRLLQGPLSLEAPGGLRWQGAVYGGPFRLQRDAHGTWTLIEQVPLERYLEGVLPHEIGATAPAAALAAQAVLARTWALRNLHRYRADGYHLCASVQCQVYSDPQQATAAVRSAIHRTRAQVLTWEGQPIHAVYHASNGGVAASLAEAWDASPLPYLRAGLDRATPQGSAMPPLPPLGSLGSLLQTQDLVGPDHPLFRWTRSLNRQQVATALARQGLAVGPVQRLLVSERGPSGRVTALTVEGQDGRVVLRRDAIRRTLRQLPSTLFALQPLGPGRWRLQGGGFGHGVGLSQAAAIALARLGWTYPSILQRYYPGTQLQTWQQLSAGPLGGDP
ncbi:MAG: SpoIID/LytB domain-containing protein [Cyanobacteriota bacterium]|nr:SpoIID/LytB domain-containing protein [Cyanobacteriota bacterium]